MLFRTIILPLLPPFLHEDEVGYLLPQEEADFAEELLKEQFVEGRIEIKVKVLEL